MNLKHVTINVKNMQESLEFYNKLIGLPVKNRFSPAPGSEIVFLGEGGTEIELICNESHTDVSFGGDISVGFQVDSVPETIETLKQNGIVPGDILKPNPNVRFFFVSDPNGLRVQFIEYIKYA